jgi:hypothetical protein
VAVLTTSLLSQALTARGASPRWARGVVGSTPLVVGGLILLIVPHVADSAWQIVLVVIGGGLCGSIFVVCPPIISSFTPVTQRAALIAIFVAIYTSAGIFAPIVTGSAIESAATVLEGYYTGYTITGLVQLLGGLAGLLLLWPTAQNTKETVGFNRCPKGYSIIRSARVNARLVVTGTIALGSDRKQSGHPWRTLERSKVNPIETSQDRC